MKVAILTDIHSNLPALEAVLSAIDEAGIERRWCLGDVVGYGAQPDECTKLVSERCELSLVGNHDLAVTGEISTEVFSASAAAAVEWTRANSADSTIDFLKAQRPENTEHEVGLYHASPRDPVWEYVLAVDQARECIAEQASRVSFIGHSHVALWFSDSDGPPGADGGGQAEDGRVMDLSEHRWLLNPGQRGPASRRRSARRLAGAGHGRVEGRLSPRGLRHRHGGGGDQGGGPPRVARRPPLRGPIMAPERARTGLSGAPATIAAMPNSLRPIVLALFLAAAAVGILGCGGSSGPDPSISAQEAAVLSSKIDEIQANVQVGSCLVAADKTDDLIADVQELPSSVNSDVKSALQNGANQLKILLADPTQCQGRTTTSQTTTSTPSTTASTTTKTQPTTTTRTQTQPTTTTNTSTQGTTIGGNSGGIGPGQMSPRSPKGELISDRYRIEDRLGSGGMSTVFRATDTILERTVAVKILAEHLSDDDRFVARFRREALAVAKLVHPNIVQVYDTGNDGGQYYIVMEYVRGRSGAQLLQAEGKLDPETSVEIGVQACAGLDYAHRHGIIHRDVKPGNLMIIGGPAGGGDMTVKLADFGIARASEQTRITQVGSVVGTAAYLAPEQARGEEANPSTDVYSLGVVLYQFLTGRLPYEGASLAELAVRQQSEQPLHPSSYSEDVPEAVGDAVLVALESDPSRRFAAAGELADALRRGLTGESPVRTAQTRVLGGDAPTSATRHMPRTRTQRQRRPVQPRGRQAPAQAPRRRRAPQMARNLLALIAILLLAAAVAAIVVLASSNSGGKINLDQVVKQNVNDQIDALKQVVDDNTK